MSDLWRRNFLVLLGFAILFQLTQVFLIEFFPHFDGGSSITIFAQEDAETRKRNAELLERKAARRQGQGKSEKEGAENAEEDG